LTDAKLKPFGKTHTNTENGMKVEDFAKECIQAIYAK